MVTNGRTFLRDFTTFNAKARRGETVRVKDKEGVFLCTADAPRKSLLGVARARLYLKPISPNRLPDDDWKPSL